MSLYSSIVVTSTPSLMLFHIVMERKRKEAGHSAFLRFLLDKTSVTEGFLLKVSFLTAVDSNNL